MGQQKFLLAESMNLSLIFLLGKLNIGLAVNKVIVTYEHG